MVYGDCVRIVYSPEAERELAALPPNEREAMRAALEKLEQYGDLLSAPHSSAVKGAGVTLRELRPRSGRSPWRGFYRRVGEIIAIGAFGPEAEVNPRGFKRSVRDAVARLAEFERTSSDV